jgi:type II secretory pathway pseudopilin PulG
LACTNHPERTETLDCSGCGKPFCESCLVRFEKLSLCASCKARYLTGVEEHPVAPRAPAARRPRGGGGALPWLGGIAALVFAFAFVIVIVATLSQPWQSWRKDRRQKEAVDRLVQIGAALERYHADKGHFPDALPALVPDYLKTLPADPFAKSAGPPRYQQDDAGRHLWSVGPDQKDDGGESPADLVYEVQD